jgi:Calponin homology (CH) domain
LLVSSVDSLRKGPALNDIASLILNTSPPKDIYRDNIDSNNKILHNLKKLLDDISELLPNNLSKITAKELLKDETKIFLILRWMIKILDFPFYQKLKSSFQGIYSKSVPSKSEESKIDKMKTMSLENMLEKTPNRMKNPETSEYTSPLTVKNIDILKTLKDLHVFNGKTLEDFISLCESGELLADLINVLEGKEEKIKGISRKPKSLTSKAANVSKVLKYLRSFPKMSSTYIWSEKEITEGSVEVIKGLIYDILALYKKNFRSQTLSATRSSFMSSPAIEVNSPKLLVQRQSPKRQPKARIIEPRSQDVPEPEVYEREIVLNEESKERVSEWLVNLQLGHLIVSPSGDFTGDNLRNGVVLCEIAALIENEGDLVKYHQPRSVIEARENIENAFNVIREHDKGVPVSLVSNPNRIIKGESEAIWGLLCHLMLAYPNLSSPKIMFKDLPYTPEQIRELEDSILAFIMSRGVLDRTRIPGSFQELLPDIVSGVLLSDLISRVIDTPIHGIFRSPTTQTLALSNIKKSLAPLRSIRKMGMKYVWSEDEILKGDLGVILGLLEDLHRYSDGVTPRQRGINYHKDGPYYGRPFNNLLKINKSHQKINISLSSEVPDKPQTSPSHRILIHSVSNAVIENKNELSSAQISQLHGFSWLVQIDIAIPPSLDLSLDTIPDFKTGELFASILEKLERSKIPGLHPKVTSQAACLHNLGKIFGLLKNKPGFPSYLCFVEEEVYKGDGDIIRAVLTEIYKIYRRTINSLKSFNNRKLGLD